MNLMPVFSRLDGERLDRSMRRSSFSMRSWDCVAVALEWRPPCPAGFDTAPWHKIQIAAAMITVKTLESI
jgi:hypothetical protein